LSRLNDKSKNWKFSISDLEERKYWDSYMKVYSDMLTKTSTEHSPWYVIPADKKWFMRFAVSEIICEEMKKLDIDYPKLSEQAKENIEQAKEILKNM
jgi:polyphosphate kinase 2 (PPK2 family)